MMNFLEDNKVCIGIVVAAVITIVVLVVLYLMKKDENCEFKDEKCSLRKKEGYTARLPQVSDTGYGTTVWGNSLSGNSSGFSGKEPPVFWPQGGVGPDKNIISSDGYKIGPYGAVVRKPDKVHVSASDTDLMNASNGFRSY
jgi:hypothetical protein